MAQTPEGRVKAAVKKYLKDIGAYYYMPVSNGMGRVGAPDFLVCWEGRFVGVETKAPGRRGNTTPNQDREIAAINAANGLAVVVDDVEQLKEILHAEIIPPGTQDQGGVQQAPRRPGQARGEQSGQAAGAA